MRLVGVAKHYPLKRCFLVGSGSPLFGAAWSVLRPLLDEATHDKVVFCEDGNADVTSVLGGAAAFSEESDGPHAGPLCAGTVGEAVGFL